MTRHATGVLNGNFRNGDYYRYAQEVSRGKFDFDFQQATLDLQDLMGDAFNDWWDSYPATMSKGEFLPIMKAKIAALQAEPHPADVARAMDYDTDAEAREIAAEVERYVEGQKFQPRSRAEAISLDENGQLRPYSSFPRTRGAVMSTHDAEVMYGEDWRDLDF
jgi:hypothetical protein